MLIHSLLRWRCWRISIRTTPCRLICRYGSDKELCLTSCWWSWQCKFQSEECAVEHAAEDANVERSSAATKGRSGQKWPCSFESTMHSTSPLESPMIGTIIQWKPQSATCQACSTISSSSGKWSACTHQLIGTNGGVLPASSLSLFMAHWLLSEEEVDQACLALVSLLSSCAQDSGVFHLTRQPDSCCLLVLLLLYAVTMASVGQPSLAMRKWNGRIWMKLQESRLCTTWSWASTSSSIFASDGSTMSKTESARSASLSQPVLLVQHLDFYHSWQS